MTGSLSPILTTLLDTDAYKLHMQQAVFHRYQNVTVTAEFISRDFEISGTYADEIIAEINQMSTLALSDDEYLYLKNLPFFKPDYLDWLRSFRYDPEQIQVRHHGGKLAMNITGRWLDVIMWEVPLLALVSEFVQRHRFPSFKPALAVERLREKIAHFRLNNAHRDLSDLKVIDFGTRRRFSREVHIAVVTELQKSFPWLAGSSNYDIARRLDLTPLGTQAHEWFQAHQQISSKLADSQREALQTWLDEYEGYLGIALTDCITMDAFLRDFDLHFASAYKGLRHDSGDPVEWGEKAIAHYEKLGIDPLSKTLVFSDGLDFEKAAQLHCHFQPRIQTIFGIGTQLTCDIPHVKPLNIVIKLVKCNGSPVAKISDSPGKTVCQDLAFLQTLRRAFRLSEEK